MKTEVAKLTKMYIELSDEDLDRIAEKHRAYESPSGDAVFFVDGAEIDLPEGEYLVRE